jgi:aspartyl-tRNA(Asn)/glutamyl-tRNA(Gln) amidotransferase subunit A
MEIPLNLERLQEGLLKKEFSAVELVDSYIDRIRTFDKDINSLITITDEVAYKSAKNVDAIIKDLGKNAFIKHPLLGAVVVHKDLFLIKNIRTTAGSNVLKSYQGHYSGTVVRRLNKAGAIVLGKANCDAWAHGASGENSDFGPTKNPWNKDYVPGGSSSGSAASVAANFCTFSTGTDTGGSIRQPANFCGTVGFKPTYGVVSRYGVIAMASSLDSIGHFTRSVDEAKRIFEVVKGPDGFDSNVKKSKFIKKDKDIKIGIPKEYFIKGIKSDVKENVKKAIKVFEKMGIKTQEVSLPHTKYAISIYYIIQPAEVSSNLGRYDGIRFADDRSAFSSEAKRRIMLGTYVLSEGYYDAYYLKAMKVRSKIIEDFNQVFKKVDALITPVSPTKAFKLGEKTKDPLQMYLADVLTVSANLAGIPAISIPYGFSSNGLPLGFQLMGPRLSENILFKLGRQFEEKTNYVPKKANL